MSAEKIAELKQRQAELEQLQAEIEAEKPRLMAEFVEGVRQHCADYDFPVAEVVAMLKSPKKQDRRSEIKQWRHKNNPELVYGGRALPKWMKQDMSEKGLDPSDKAQRESYRAEYLEEAA